MLHFRDMTFCSETTCCNEDCSRLITDGLKSASFKCGLPMAVADFKNTDMCPGYIKWLTSQESSKDASTPDTASN